ncbi:DNA-packaging protein FI, partial [Salmonella enterica]|uniref:DNA-packaging protein FI n=1 Tax=Salmonella enterica TaxID=28901 RepID=UPI000AAE259F
FFFFTFFFDFFFVFVFFYFFLFFVFFYCLYCSDSTDSDVTGAEKVKAEAGTKGDRVSVETLATLHVEALHATRNESVSIVEPGVIIRVSERDADELISKGLAREV